MKFKELIASSVYAKLIASLAIILIIFMILSGGIAIGYQKAAFRCGWDTNYARNFRRLPMAFAPFMHDEDNLNSHGAFGNIISVNIPQIIVRGQNQAEQIITIGTTTEIRQMRFPAVPTDLKPGQKVVVIGNPDPDGRIRASLIRIITLPDNI